MPNFKHDYARLINQARVELPGSSDAGIKQALFTVFHEFFTDSNLWQEEITVQVEPDTTDYPLYSDEPGEIVRLLCVMDSGGFGQAATLADLDTLVIRNAPNSADNWVATVAKTVGSPIDREGQPAIPDWVLARWEPIVVEGLYARLMMQPAKPYSNPQLANFHYSKFRGGVAQARSAVLHGNTFGANTWIYPQGWSTRRRGGGSDRSFN